MPGKMRRLINLYKLLWVEDRLDALEAQGTRLRTQGTRLQDRISASQEQQNLLRIRLQEQRADLQTQISALQEQQDLLRTHLQEQGTGLQAQMQAQIDHILEHLTDQVDSLKSSLEVSPELMEEFHEWKAHNPIPKEPLVSVTVATYNRARLLTERCIPSVLNQTYSNLELIVVGDGCTDDTEERIAEIHDPRLKFVNLTDRGSYPSDPERWWMVAGTTASNEGLSMARGDFITHLDDDDEYTPDRLEKLVKFTVENGCDLVWHPFWWEQSTGDWVLIESANFALAQVTNGSVLYRSWFKKLPWDVDAHRLMEPGDWNRYRRIKYIGPASVRYPEPLLKHYREKSQS